MSYLTLTNTLTAEGIEVRHPILGKVATIVRETGPCVNAWYVRPYRFAIYERGMRFKSLDAANAYTLALAYEMHHLQIAAAPTPADHERAPIGELGPKLDTSRLTGPDGEAIPAGRCSLAERPSPVPM